MKKLIALLTAAVATLTSAWAATVAVDGNTVTIINTAYNDSNYGWNGVTSFTVTLPVKEGTLVEGDTYALSSIQIVKASSYNTDAQNTPATLTIAGITATRSDATGTDANWDGGRTVSTYTFSGTKPILTVGSATTVATTGPGTLRACPTQANGDTDNMIGIGNTTYQPLTKIVCEKITTTTAEITTNTEGVSEITWSNETPSETNPGVLTIDEGVTLSVTDLSALANVTLAGAGTLKVTGSMTINRAYTSPVTFGAEWTGTLHLVGTTMAYCDFNKFVGVGKVKVTGVAGHLDNGKTFPGELILEDNGDTKALTVNNGDSNNYYAIQALSGSGTFYCTNNGATQQTIIKSAANFTGTVTIEGTGKSVVFANVGAYQNNCNGSIVIGGGSNITIAEGKNWSAGNKILIQQNGTLTVPATFASAVKGTGKLAGYTAFSQVTDAVKTSLQDAAWAGSLVVTGSAICQNSNYVTTLNNFGNEGSKIEFGNCNGYMSLSKNNGSDVVKILPEIVIAGDVALNDGFSQSDRTPNYFTYFRKVSGTGTLRCTKGTINPLFIIEDASAFAGNLTATNMKVVVGEPKADYTGNLVLDNTITIEAGKAMTIASGKAFTAANGLVVDGTLTVNNGATGQVVEKLTIGANGTVSVAQGDWIKFRAASRQDIVIKGTLNLNGKRQTLYPNNPITLYPGAQIIADATSTDNGCHLNFFNRPTLTLAAEAGNDATEATISAIIGPQGGAVTFDVAEGLTLNLTETNSSSTDARKDVINKAGEGTLKIDGNYGTLAGFTLNAGKIVTTAGAVLPMTTDETPVAKITVAEGSTLYTKTDDNGVTTYQLTPFDQTETLPGEELISDTDKAAEYKTWATGIGVTEADADNADKLVIGFLLGATEVETVADALDAAQTKVEDLLKEIDLGALAGEGEEAALEALNTELAEKGLVASLVVAEEIEAEEGKSAFYKLSITIKTTPTDN
ncbi:MAG: hypothetical protein MJ109_03165 [Kiritimatiellae bacterium]|nr:hypothetical protein [Kiritimatiellia bacterium]